MSPRFIAASLHGSLYSNPLTLDYTNARAEVDNILVHENQLIQSFKVCHYKAMCPSSSSQI